MVAWGFFLVSAPHNMDRKRAIAHFNKVKSIQRQSTSLETITKRLTISLNGVGTANYDPRPAVIKFLESKDRRFRDSDFKIYQKRDFVKKVFTTETTV